MTDLWTRYAGATTLSAAMLLAACGGGGGSGETDADTPPISLEQAQGIWRGTLGSDPADALVLPDGQAWLVISRANGARELWQTANLQAASNTLQGSGKRYAFSLTNNNVVVSDFSVQVAAAAARQGVSATVTSGTQSWPLNLASYDSRYDSPAVLNDWMGTWQSQVGVGTVTWTVSGTESAQRAIAGVGAGTGQDDCAYAGTLTTRAEGKAALNIHIKQTCNGVATALQGVATLSATKTQASFTLLAQEGQSAALLALVRR